jgi:putative hydrolase of the HAD superfamily
MTLVCLDAMGTLLELERPFARLVLELAARGAPVGQAAAERALRAEMAYYRAHHDSAVDLERLELLRDRCTTVLRDALPHPAGALPHADVRAALLAALRFRAFPEVPGALRALRAGGHRLVVVSNWDVSLHGVLEATGLAPLVDAVITSAEAGAAKPDPAIFAAAGASGAHGLHAGDSREHDVAGARAAGLRPVLVDRAAEGGPGGGGGSGADAAAADGVAVVRSLTELPSLAAYAAGS